MNKERYVVYLEGLEKGYWYVDHGNGCTYFHSGVSINTKWKEDVHIFSRSAGETYKSKEFQEALKTWDKIKNSPLIKALA